MNRDCFKPLKDFNLYEINANGDVRKRTTKRHLSVAKTKSGDRFYLSDSGHILTISRSKLQYCYKHGTSPYEIRDKVVSNGVLLSVAEHCENLKLLNIERLEHIRNERENADLIFQYENGVEFMSMMVKLLKGELNNKDGQALQSKVISCIRKALVRYYRDKGEYRKEEINDIAKDVFYGTFLQCCPLNLDCYVYEIVKRKFGNKKRDSN